MPAILKGLRGSQCPELVILLTGVREYIHPQWYDHLLELVARVQSDGDRESARIVLEEIRRDPLLFATFPTGEQERRAMLAQRMNRKARRAARGRA